MQEGISKHSINVLITWLKYVLNVEQSFIRILCYTHH